MLLYYLSDREAGESVLYPENLCSACRYLVCINQIFKENFFTYLWN
jgi:hypothetical protein